MFCLYASPLVLLFLAEVECSVNKAIFNKEASLADKVCPDDRKVFEQQAVSLVSCVAVAFRTIDCAGVSYNEEQQMCYGCNTLTDGEFQHLLGTVFYSRPKAYPDGFEDISGYMLMVTIDQGLTYDQAHDACAEHSASLVRIDSVEKQEAIRDHLIGLNNGKAYWIQCRKDVSDGVWKFDDETSVPMTNDYWFSSSPSGSDGSNCGYVMPFSGYYWKDTNCIDAGMDYICEIK